MSAREPIRLIFISVRGPAHRHEARLDRRGGGGRAGADRPLVGMGAGVGEPRGTRARGVHEERPRQARHQRDVGVPPDRREGAGLGSRWRSTSSTRGQGALYSWQ